MTDIEQSTVAGVAVGDQGRACHLGHCIDASEHVAVSRQACIGQTQMRRDRTKASHVQAVKTEGICQTQGNHIVNTRCGDQAGLFQASSERSGFIVCHLAVSSSFLGFSG